MAQCPNCLKEGDPMTFCQDCYYEHDRKFWFVNSIEELGE